MLLNKRTGTLSLLAGFAFLASACGVLRRTDKLTLGSDVQLVDEATITCSQECTARGQCGQAEEGEMVLLHSQKPVTRDHDMAISDGTVVFIDHREMRAAIQAIDSEQIQVPYYLVIVPERGPGWVPGWCIGQ